MKNHGHKEPPLRELVNHKKLNFSSVSYYLSLFGLALVMGWTIAEAIA